MPIIIHFFSSHQYLLLFKNDVRSVQGWRTSQGRGLESKKHPNPGDNATNRKGSNSSEREGKYISSNRRPNPKQQTTDKPLLPFRSPVSICVYTRVSETCFWITMFVSLCVCMFVCVRFRSHIFRCRFIFYFTSFSKKLID